jgi:hypothetical protein
MADFLKLLPLNEPVPPPRSGLAPPTLARQDHVTVKMSWRPSRDAKPPKSGIAYLGLAPYGLGGHREPRRRRRPPPHPPVEPTP